MPERRRISFEALTDVYAAVRPKERREKSRYINQAIRAFENPPYRFQMPAAQPDVSLLSLLQRAAELVFVGINLGAIRTIFGKQLHAKVQDNTPISFVIMNPDIPEDHFLYNLLVKQSGSRQFVENLKQQGRQSLEFFMNLKEVGHSNGTSVDVRTCLELPSYGLVIADRYSRRPRMRMSIYSTIRLNRADPYLDIYTNTDAGMQMYRVLYSYYEQLSNRSEPVSSGEPAANRPAGV